MKRTTSASPLVLVLRRHPFVSRDLLVNLLGRRRLETLLAEERSRIQGVEVAGLGFCHAESNEPKATLLGLWRYHIARGYALGLMGPAAVLQGASPGIEADGEFCWRQRRWRVWVDTGVCAPEALRFVHEPPFSYRGGVRDLIVTLRADRLDQVARLVERTWSAKSRPVNMFQVGVDRDGGIAPGKERIVIRPRRRGAVKTWSSPTSRELERAWSRRQKGDRHRSLLGEIARKLEAQDWDLLVRVGSNPLMTFRELAVMTGPDASQQEQTIRRLKELEGMLLVEIPPSPVPEVTREGRRSLTWRGVELLAHHAGSSLKIFSARQPWPLRRDARKKGKMIYSLRWLRSQGEHQRKVREFALATLEGARRVSRDTGGVDVEIVTTIGGRIAYEDQGAFASQGIQFIAPDALLQARAWDAPWLDGRVGRKKELCRRILLVEVDRSTMAIDRLAERLNRYVDVWHALGELHPLLIWVVDGTPYREAQILELMKERRLDGRTATVERLRLPADDTWWLVNYPSDRGYSGPISGLRVTEFGSLCPWRPIWHKLGVPGHQNLLDVAPWKRMVTSSGNDRRISILG